MAAKKKAVKKAGKELAVVNRNKSIANYEDRLASMAKADSSRGHKMGESAYISTQGGILTHQGAELPNPILAIITDFAYENAFYQDVYDPDAPAPPACFAIGDDPDELIPSDTSPALQVAAGGMCEGCDMNVYGTAITGKGKACKNGARIALVNAMNAGEELDVSLCNAASEPSFLRISPTSLKHFEKYKSKITKVTGKPLLAMVTEIELVPFKTWYELHFTLTDEIADEQLLQNMLAVHDNYRDILREPYDVSGFDDAPKKNVRRGGKPGKKKTAKKKTAKKKTVRASKY